MVCLEAQGQLAIAVQQRAFDHGGVLQQQGTGLGGVQPLLGLLRQGAEGGATGVEQGFPAQLGEPEIELLRTQTVGAVIVKALIDTRLLQPLAGLLDGVAVLDAIEGGGHGRSYICGPGALKSEREITQGPDFGIVAQPWQRSWPGWLVLPAGRGKKARGPDSQNAPMGAFWRKGSYQCSAVHA